MDLVANSIQRALTSKLVVKASEQKVKEQTSDSGARDSKVLYEAVSQENNQVIASIETQLQEKRSLLAVNISNLKADLALADQITMMFYRTLMNGSMMMDDSKYLEVDYLHSLVYI